MASGGFPKNIPSFKNIITNSFPSLDSTTTTPFISEIKKESAEMLLNKNGPGALNISADDQIKQQQSVSSATGSSLSTNVSNSIVSRQITQRISYQHLLSNNILGPAESFKVEDALPFNPIETQPLQIKKLFTPGRSVSVFIVK
uniref:Uncharacterized protein n=1 Tax=Panagrolaimus davidi TaxID=227884 RepID=A0A914PR05_9BILA